MDVAKAIRARRSVRAYLDKPVEEDKLQRVLDAARLAPSACNMQEWKFVVVRDDATRRNLVDVAMGQAFVGQAPVVIAACATVTDYTMTCGQLAYPIDVAIAVDHMTLQAVEEGLGTCWIGAFHEDRARALIGVPDDIRIVTLLPLGYPADGDAADEREKDRNTIDQIVAYDKWS